MDDGEHLYGIFFFKWRQGIKSLSVFCQAHRDYGEALHIGDVPRQLLNGIIQLLPVVYPLAEHNLAVHQHAPLKETFQLRKGIPGKTVV